jgi:hypothetical protein
LESLDLEVELNNLRLNSHFDSDFDSTIVIDEYSERIVKRSNPTPAKVRREINRLDEPYQPANNSATGGKESATDWIRSLLTRFTKCPNQVIFDTSLSDGEVRVLLALNALDWNEKGWSEHSEKTMAGLIGKKARQFRNILTSLRKKDKVFQRRRGDHKTAKLYTKVRVEGNAVVEGYKRD